MDSARRFRWILTLLLVLPAWAQGPCDCIDKADIKERIARAQNALKAYGEEMAKIGWAPYTAEGRKALEELVEQAIFEQKREGINLGAGGHTSNLCIMEINAPTRCLEEAIRRHEKVHQEACLRTLESHMKEILFGNAADRFEANGATMSGYIMEEVMGYSAEIAFLQSELARLERDCQPPRRDYSSPARSDGALAPPPPKGPPSLSKPKPITAPPKPEPPPATAPHR